MEDLLYKAWNAIQQGQNCAFATIVEATVKGTPRKSGAKMVVFEDGSSWGTIGGGRNEKAAIAECLKAIQSGKPASVTYDYFGKEGQSVCGGQIKVFIEPFKKSKHLIICGAGHIALPLSFIAKMLNFKVTVIDNRKEFANKNRFPYVDEVLLGPHAEVLSKMPINSQIYIMIVTQGNEFDYECLKTVVKTDAAYIGVISSRAKRIKFFNRLKETGVAEKYLKRIYIPAGIDLGAQTPTEIAVSIAAEIIKNINQETLNTDKFKEKIRKEDSK